MRYESLGKEIERRRAEAHETIDSMLRSGSVRAFIEAYCTLLDLYQMDVKGQITLKQNHVMAAQWVSRADGELTAYGHVLSELLGFLESQKENPDEHEPSRYS